MRSNENEFQDNVLFLFIYLFIFFFLTRECLYSYAVKSDDKMVEFFVTMRFYYACA